MFYCVVTNLKKLKNDVRLVENYVPVPLIYSEK